MSDVQVTVTDNGPLKIEGEVVLTDDEGKAYTQKSKFYLCRCGQSNRKPFCDGSHSRTGFQSTCRAPE